MKGVINSFKRSRHVLNPMQLNIAVDGVTKNMVGKKVVWNAPDSKNTISGKITAMHGSTRQVRAIMEKGVPGKAIGTSVEIN